MPKKIQATEPAENEAASSPKAALQFDALDKKSFTPMYFQIQSQLRKMIDSGQLKPGDLLPSEDELSRVYKVSRMTARQALQSLKNLGLASRHKGRGTFVSEPRVEKDITHLAGFTAEMKSLGMRPSSKVLVVEQITADAETARTLEIEAGEPVFRLRRLRLANDIPMAVEEIRLPLKRFPGIGNFNFAQVSLYQMLREHYSIRLSMADEVLEACAAKHEEAQLLQVPLRSSLLVIKRTLWGVDGKPIESACSFYRGDRYHAVLCLPATSVE